MDKPVYMKCGHATFATIGPDNIPICPICLCHEIADEPTLEGREARCTYGCGSKRPSSFDLPFFRYCPGSEYDRYYCGCEGWD